MATTLSSGPARFVATVAAVGTGLGLVLAAARVGHPAACSTAVSHAGVCVSGALLSVKPYVTAGLIGLLLGALIAIAAVLTWREARTTVASVRHRGTARRPRPASRASRRRGVAVAHRLRH